MIILSRDIVRSGGEGGGFFFFFFLRSPGTSDLCIQQMFIEHLL